MCIRDRSTRRSWRSFDLNEFQSALRLSPLCNPEQWHLVKLYDDTVVELLDRQVPTRTVTCRRRPSDGWFDSECKHAKRRVRRLERAARHVGPLSDCQSPAVQAWRTERRQYFELVRRKRANFWTARIDADERQQLSFPMSVAVF